VKQKTFKELLTDFDPSVHGLLEDKMVGSHVEGMIVFENIQMDSSAFGDRSAVIYGPSCTLKSPADVDGKWLGDLPSQRKYPVYFVPKVWA